MANLGKARKKAKRKTNGPVPKRQALATLREAQDSRHDFIINGVRYHSPRFLGHISERPWGSVDISSGDKTYTLTNQFGSWMVPVPDGYLREPASLGLGSQLEVSTNLIARFDAFLRDEGIRTVAQKRAAQEVEEKAKRKRPIKPKGALAKLKKRKSA